MRGKNARRTPRSGSQKTPKRSGTVTEYLGDHQGRRSKGYLTLCVCIVSLLVSALFTHSQLGSWNDSSRLATAEALVEQGTWAIESTRLNNLTADKLWWNGHFYSDKPPVLSFLAAGVYATVRAATGAEFIATYCLPTFDTHYCFALFGSDGTDWAYYIVTLVLVGLPFALMLGLFYRATGFFGLTNPAALLLTGTLGLGTMVFPFSLVFSNHVPAAAGLMLGFYALLRSRQSGESAQRWLVVGGFGTALAVTFDLLALPLILAFLASAVYIHRRKGWFFLAGAAIPLILLMVLDLWALGDPLPPSLHASGFDYPGSAFAATITGNMPSADALRHGALMLVGERGLFALNPVMLLSLVGLFLLLRRSGHPLKAEVLAVLGGSLAIIVLLALFTPGYGGISYGTRWLAEISPLLLLFAAQPSLYRGLARKAAFGVLAIASIASAWQGAINPWSVSLPPARLLQYATSPVGQYLEGLAVDAATYATPGQARYLPDHPVHAWHTSLRPFYASSGLVPAGDPGSTAVFLVDAEDLGARGVLDEVLPGGTWETIPGGFTVYQLEPSSERVSPQLKLEARFVDMIELVGCDMSTDSALPGEVVTVRLYWQAIELTHQPYTAFVHLVGEVDPSTGSTLWAQDDHQPGDGAYATNSWFPLELVVDTFDLVIPEDTPGGEYLVTTGFYDRITYERLVRSDDSGDRAELFILTVQTR